MQAVDVLAAQGERTVVLATGGRTEKAAMALYPELAEGCFVEVGDFTGAALRRARDGGLQRVIFVGMVGKLTKLAAGVLMTHYTRSAVDRELLAAVTAEAGGDAELAAAGRASQYRPPRLRTLGVAASCSSRPARCSAAGCARCSNASPRAPLPPRSSWWIRRGTARSPRASRHEPGASRSSGVDGRPLSDAAAAPPVRRPPSCSAAPVISRRRDIPPSAERVVLGDVAAGLDDPGGARGKMPWCWRPETPASSASSG